MNVTQFPGELIYHKEFNLEACEVQIKYFSDIPSKTQNLINFNIGQSSPFLMMTLVFSCMGIRAQDTIPVVDNRTFNGVKNFTVSHKDKVVVPSREMSPGVNSKAYWVNMYRIDNRKLRMYPFGSSAELNFNNIQVS